MTAAALLSGCEKSAEPESGIFNPFASYRDVPGITSEEIQAIEELRKKYASFIYGMPLSTEAFINKDGEIGGYSALFAEWLGQLFGIPFVVANFEWADTLAAFETGKIHFNGSMVPTEKRHDTFFQTSAIAQRSVVYFRLADSLPIARQIQERPVRIGVLANTATADIVITSLEPGTFEAVFIAENRDAYDLLRTGAIDAYAHSNTTKIFFDNHADIVSETFYPPVFTPVVLTAQNPELQPIISVVEKALQQNGTLQYLTFLYNKGYDEYHKNRLHLLLTDEEHAYIKSSPVIKLVAQSGNYPLSFYDRHAKEWQGIAFDILREVEVLTGLSFQVINSPTEHVADLIPMLERGEASLMSGLIQTPARAGRFLWPENVNKGNKHALISKQAFRDLRVNEVFGVRVGLLRGSAHTETFRRWFPFHTHTREYNSLHELVDALDLGEIDVAMQSESWLLLLTHYHERPDFKTNIVFDVPYTSSFGFNKNEAVLCSIVDKALSSINTTEIIRRWMSKMYDFRIKQAEERVLWLAGLSAMLLCIILLLLLLFFIRKNIHKRAMILLDAAPLACRLWDRNLQLFACNNETLRFFHLKSRQEYDERYNTLLPEYQPDGQRSIDKKQMVFQKTLDEGKHVFEFMHSLSDGTPLPCEVTLVRVKYGNEYVIAGYTRDLREHKKMMAEINAMAQGLRDANETKSIFLANMSHEMRTPLNAIIGLSDVTLEARDLSEEANLNLEKINHAGVALLSIVNDLLDLSKIDANKLELVPAEYDMPSVLNDTVSQSVTHIGEKPVRFILNIDEAFPAKLYGDGQRIRQIFNNLLSNAFKYTAEGTVEFGVSCERDGDTVWVAAYIKDTGMGISPENIEKLFKDYVQLDRKSNRKIMGTGLGLSLAKKFVDMMDGTISVTSEYGKGSTFTVRFRQKLVTAEVIGAELAGSLKGFCYRDQKHKHHKPERIRLPYARVLVVDDVATNRDVARGLMKPYGMQIDLVSSGQQAVDAIREEKVRYNAVFMDHMMPEMDGIEAVRIIREEIGTEYAGNVPIIALTANAIVGAEEMFLSKGFQAFLSKPIVPARLDAVIREWVRDERLEAEQPDIRKWVRDTTLEPEQPDIAEEQTASLQAAALSRVLSHQVDGIDLLKGLEYFDGDEESYLQVLRSYAVSTRSLLDSVRRVTPDTLAEYAITVHGIKGSSYGINAQAAGDKAWALEVAARDGNAGFVNDNNRDFIDSVEKLVTDLENMLRAIETDRNKPKKEQPDREVLVKLLEGCKTYDMDTVDAAMAELESYEYKTGGELVSWLWENVQQFNISEIKEKLSGLK